MHIRFAAATAALVVSLATAVPTAAQEAAPPVLNAVPQAPVSGAVLPANTKIFMTVNDEITTKGKKYSEGDTFGLSVSQPVMVDGFVVIPRGARATGRITWLTSKGAFGKSGKMDIALEHIDVGNTRIPIEGTYRQEGEGNTVGTVAGVVLAGVFAGFITGKSARIPQGRELSAHTKENLAVALPAGYVPRAALQAQPLSGQPLTVSEKAAIAAAAIPGQ